MLSTSHSLLSSIQQSSIMHCRPSGHPAIVGLFGYAWGRGRGGVKTYVGGDRAAARRGEFTSILHLLFERIPVAMQSLLNSEWLNSDRLIQSGKYGHRPVLI